MTLKKFQKLWEFLQEHNTNGDGSIIPEHSEKVSLLQGFVDALQLVQQACAFSSWVGLDLNIQKVETKFSQDYICSRRRKKIMMMQGSTQNNDHDDNNNNETIVAVMNHCHLLESNWSTPLMKLNLSINDDQDRFNLTLLDHHSPVFHNASKSVHMDSFRMIKFELRMLSSSSSTTTMMDGGGSSAEQLEESTSLGCLKIALQNLYHSLLESGKPIFALNGHLTPCDNSILESCEVTMVIQALTPENEYYMAHQTEKRNSYCQKLCGIVDWIERLSDCCSSWKKQQQQQQEQQPRSLNTTTSTTATTTTTCMLWKAPILEGIPLGTLLLHAAVLLQDVSLILRLWKLRQVQLSSVTLKLVPLSSVKEDDDNSSSKNNNSSNNNNNSYSNGLCPSSSIINNVVEQQKKEAIALLLHSWPPELILDMDDPLIFDGF